MVDRETLSERPNEAQKRMADEVSAVANQPGEPRKVRWTVPAADGQVEEDLDVLATKLVATWSDVPEKRKTELGRLLAGP